MQETQDAVWTAEGLLELGRSYQAAAVFAAAADLDLFPLLAQKPLSAEEAARSLNCQARGLVILLDALAALKLVEKQAERYALPAGADRFLTPGGDQSILGMAQHQANCLRNWAQLARVIKENRRAPKDPSLRGVRGDQAAFIEAMHNICAPLAGQVIQDLSPLSFNHLLDLGGASGTWTMAFLRACPAATATLFDLADRVNLVAGDFMIDPLPQGADLAWVSAIVHQNSRPQNRQLFASVFQALSPGGQIALRDIVMDENRVQPVAGALFAVNMLTATEGGGTFTFDELKEDLESAGFEGTMLRRRDPGMNSIIMARKPATP